MAQYSRHIRKGMAILESNHSGSVFAYDKSSHRLVVVGLNKGNEQHIDYDLSLFSKVGDGVVKRWTTHTKSGSDRYVERNDLHISSETIRVPFAGKVSKQLKSITFLNKFEV